MMSRSSAKSITAIDVQLTRLVYELLDAHDDTRQLAVGRIGDERWRGHLEYLRDLQRLGREMLARVAKDQLVCHARASQGSNSTLVGAVSYGCNRAPAV